MMLESARSGIATHHCRNEPPNLVRSFTSEDPLFWESAKSRCVARWPPDANAAISHRDVWKRGSMSRKQRQRRMDGPREDLDDWEADLRRRYPHPADSVVRKGERRPCLRRQDLGRRGLQCGFRQSRGKSTISPVSSSQSFNAAQDKLSRKVRRCTRWKTGFSSKHLCRR
jgi:hypothetical protein